MITRRKMPSLEVAQTQDQDHGQDFSMSALSPTPNSTTELLREIAHLKELAAAHDIANKIRFDAMEKAVELLAKFPTAIDVAVGSARESFKTQLEAQAAVNVERLKSIEIKFAELHIRLQEGERYRETALNAALKSAETLVNTTQSNFKESMHESAGSFTKQLDSIKDNVEDLKTIVREGVGSKAMLMGIIGFLIATGGIIVAWNHH